VLPRGPASGGQYRCNGTGHTTAPSSTEERCVLLSPLRGYVTRPKELSSDSGVESSWEFTVVGQSSACKNVNTEAEDIVGNRYQTPGEHSRLRKIKRVLK
jgi:hypothetical protein